MDPQATLRAILNGEATDEHWEALADWLQRGGFKPTCTHLGSEPCMIGGNGFDGPRRESQRKRQRIDGPNGLHLRTWGKRIAFVTSEARYFL